MFKKEAQDNIIIVAGGKGLRLGEPIPKQFLSINDKPILMHTIERFYQYQSSLNIILVLPEDQKEYWFKLCDTYLFTIPHTIVDGGITRFHSVLNGLATINNAEGLTGVHDGVRPFVSITTIKNCYAKARECGAVIPTIPLIDSIREITANSSQSRPRNIYLLVQTPQVFSTSILKKAYQQDFIDAFTDDASVVEALGHTITMVEGNQENIKITTPFDLVIAEAIIKTNSHPFNT
jgi:2-C-methyl-D-erythritol 4-phosphate cytidylyltransferase